MGVNSQVKPKSGVARLLEIAREKRGLLILAAILASIATLLQFTPYVAVYFIVAELLENAATPSLIDYGYIQQWGFYALLFLVGALIFIYAGNMCSHIDSNQANKSATAWNTWLQ